MFQWGRQELNFGETQGCPKHDDFLKSQTRMKILVRVEICRNLHAKGQIIITPAITKINVIETVSYSAHSN